MKERVGILGGSFNPIHLGHLILAQEAMERLSLEEMFFIPCAVPPHKGHTILADARDRLTMVERAIEGDPRFGVSDIEIRRVGVSYTIDTIEELKACNPDKEFIFVIGSDMLLELKNWHKIHDLLQMCRFAVFLRPGSNVEKLRPDDLGLGLPFAQRILEDCYRGRLVEISSSEIRRRVAEGLSIKYLVPDPVEVYISEHRLYG